MLALAFYEYLTSLSYKEEFFLILHFEKNLGLGNILRKVLRKKNSSKRNPIIILLRYITIKMNNVVVLAEAQIQKPFNRLCLTVTQLGN